MSSQDQQTPGGEMEILDASETEIEYKPRVEFKLREGEPLPEIDEIEEYFDKREILPWGDLKDAYPDAVIRPVFTTLSREELNELEATAQKRNPDYQWVNYPSYFTIEFPPGTDSGILKEVVWDLVERPEVETAYLAGRPGPPPETSPTDTPVLQGQEYFSAAPDGINAEHAWSHFQPGEAGAGMKFVDLEQGWRRLHTGLATKPVPQISGHNRRYRPHGTAALGIVIAMDRVHGVFGIAPGASPSVISEYRTVNASDTEPADAISDAIRHLGLGDVLLLETQHFPQDEDDGGPWPIEAERAVYDIITTAVSNGIVVVEAAGNGGEDIETFVDVTGSQVLNPGSQQYYGDPEAILVAAAILDNSNDWVRHPTSNYGTRVHCFAQGVNIHTLWTNDSGFDNSDTPNFGETSGASAIIAGAALLVQSVTKKNPGTPLDPGPLRAALSSPANGTRSKNGPQDGIGVMPDLKKII